MLQSKAQLKSVSMQLQTQASMVRAAGCMKRSGEVMAGMNKLMKVPELQKIMVDMAKEMERAGLVEEMIGDAMDIVDSDDVEEETDLQINAVVAEITSDLFKDSNAIPTAMPAQAPAEEVEEEEPAENLDAMKARLQAL